MVKYRYLYKEGGRFMLTAYKSSYPFIGKLTIPKHKIIFNRIVLEDMLSNTDEQGVKELLTNLEGFEYEN